MSSSVSKETAGRAGQLAKGQLRTIDAIAISVSVLSPPWPCSSTPAASPRGRRVHPAVHPARRHRLPGAGLRGHRLHPPDGGRGYAYTYVSRSLGKPSGFLAGWLYAFGFMCFVPMTMAAVGFLLADLLGLATRLVDRVLRHRHGAAVVLSIDPDPHDDAGADRRRHR